MPRGGPRIGAGRPKGVDSKQTETLAEAKKLPLQYMLDVMNDPEADRARRDRMAVAAAPFVHGRATDEEKGKKAQRQADAKTAQTGTSWEEDLPSHAPH
jgi:hypothetical protein